MRTNPYKREYPHGDLLNGDARAVIEAEFQEMRTGNQKHSLAQFMRDRLEWIKQRLHRA